MSLIEKKYTSADYLSRNPSWDIEDSPWKARKVHEILSPAAPNPKSICDVGCGAGGVLAGLRSFYPDSELVGFDIAPDASKFWAQHDSKNINFHLGNFLEKEQPSYEVLLLLDVLEHLENPFEFAARIRDRAQLFVFHIPLDLSALSVIREQPLLLGREKVGHIHYFTKEIALCFLRECEYEILEWRYTGASLSGPSRTWKTRLASFPRRLAYAVHKDFGVRFFGGETLMVLAKPGN